MENDELDFSDILASSVHDMKNSLSMVLHSIDELGQSLAGVEHSAADRLATLQYEAARVNNDLVQLLSLYKLDRNLLSANIDEHAVRDFLENELARYTPLFDARNVNCDLQCAEDLTAYFDSDLVAGVLGNVFANSIRYARSQLRIAAFSVNAGIRIVVEDDGEGFPEKMLSAEEGSALHGSNFVTGSTQLGLYFARKIAALHRNGEQYGYIELDNGGDLGGGRFSLLLP